MNSEAYLLATVGFLLGAILILLSEKRQLRKSLAQRDQVIQKQLNLLMSRDPMTYATLSASDSYQAFPEVVPMDDQAELQRWADSQGLGEVILDNDSPDLSGVYVPISDL